MCFSRLLEFIYCHEIALPAVVTRFLFSRHMGSVACMHSFFRNAVDSGDTMEFIANPTDDHRFELSDICSALEKAVARYSAAL